jgi:DNA invertase Pin-like site-specific DNA recombinase
MRNFRTYAYLRASTKEQNADRAKGSLQQFASEHDLVISTFFTENESPF